MGRAIHSTLSRSFSQFALFLSQIYKAPSMALHIKQQPTTDNLCDIMNNCDDILRERTKFEVKQKEYLPCILN